MFNVARPTISTQVSCKKAKKKYSSSSFGDEKVNFRKKWSAYLKLHPIYWQSQLSTRCSPNTMEVKRESCTEWSIKSNLVQFRSHIYVLRRSFEWKLKKNPLFLVFVATFFSSSSCSNVGKVSWTEVEILALEPQSVCVIPWKFPRTTEI